MIKMQIYRNITLNTIVFSVIMFVLKANSSLLWFTTSAATFSLLQHWTKSVKKENSLQY
jgi:hypothetical protein